MTEPNQRLVGVAGAAALALCFLLAPASAQVGAPVRCPDGSPPAEASKLETCAPVRPPEGTPPRETLTEKLDRTDGILPAPPGLDPGIRQQAPDPTPGTTPVIPPAGIPQGDQPPPK